MVRSRLLAITAGLFASALPAGAQVKSRTIDLPRVFAEGAFPPLPARTIELPPITADGGFASVVKPRTIDLPKIFGSGVFAPVNPRTIDLTGISGLGVFVKVSKSIQLPAYTASPPKGGRK